MPDNTMTTGELHRLADRLTARGTSQNLAQQIVETLLRHVSPSDVFSIYGPEGG